MTLEVTQNSAGVTANSPGAARGNAATLASDFETFLKMLTAQARYQDPLDPIDSTEYAAQLAQFSMVEQQVLTNDRLAALSAGFDTFTAASLASWIGMETQAAAPAQFGGAPVTIVPSVAGGADAAVLVVKDASGAPVQRLPIGTSDDPFDWMGQDDSGAPFPQGVYSFEVESRKNGELLSTAPAAVYARVAEARIEEGKVILVLQGGGEVAAAAVTALRRPS